MPLSTVSDWLDVATVNELARVWIGYDECSRAIVDGDLRIAWANTAARAMLARARDVENRAGRLRTIERNRQPALQDFVTGSGVAMNSWCLPRGSGDGHIVFQSQRLGWEEGALFGVSFFGSGSDFKLRLADLERVFGLTSSENRILIELLDGSAAEAIAIRAGGSIETVRSHIRHIYGKVGVGSREALFSRVLPYRVG
jgi:DNA-binding CsgD family transcriptional regulator